MTRRLYERRQRFSPPRRGAAVGIPIRYALQILSVPSRTATTEYDLIEYAGFPAKCCVFDNTLRRN